MLTLHRIFALALVSVACASKLNPRQATNTNVAINTAVDKVDETMHQSGPAILTLQASHKLNTATLSTQFTTMEKAFTTLRTTLAATPVSSGSTTVSPTNDEIGVTLSDAVAKVATTLSGIAATGAVPGFPTMVATFDPILSSALAQYNVTLPGALSLVHTMMLDASQFFVDEGFTKTLATLGF
ncbi:POXA3b laccase small subunit [Mycena alexandri]|uniref:POXA3b laccase small subunit n=1 Tax=Mycena alexandri TaxID=1745969 RepID=A0AAD6T7W9_9AGAR|nr:POXA3b laccase small subunit [Mycena alexandri]